MVAEIVMDSGGCAGHNNGKIIVGMSGGSLFEDKRIAGAAAALRIANEDAVVDKCENVTMSCVLRALGELRIL